MFNQKFDGYSVEVSQDGDLILSINGGRLHSVAGRHWQIGTGWHDEAPEKWYHSTVTALRDGGSDRFILEGVIRLPEGICFCKDVCTVLPDVLEVTRSWEYHGTPVPQATLAVEFIFPEKFPRLLMPGIFYCGNPSGAGSGNVPLIPMQENGAGFFEEHRFPAPFVSAEADRGIMAAIHTVPSQLPEGIYPDLWWSLGAVYGKDFLKMAAYSGFVHSNGRNGAVKKSQNQWSVIPGCCISLGDDQTIVKNFRLQIAPVEKRGSGFIPALESAMDFFAPQAIPVCYDELIRKKYDYALERYISVGGGGGNLIRPAWELPNAVVFGWTGRSETLAMAGKILGKKFDDPGAYHREKEIFDLLTDAPFDQNGFSVRYEYPDGVWSKERNFVSQGQALETFSFALRQKQRLKEDIPAHWMDFLGKSCDFFSRRILSDSWYPHSTAEAFLAAPLVNAYHICGCGKYKDAAIKAAEHFIKRHISLDEPYWGGTLDARCEDKEGAAAAVSAFFQCWELTGDKKFLDAAYHAAMLLLTYLQLWDISMPPGSILARKDFRSTGWSAVSVQNMHLDVYGVWVAPLIYQLGIAVGRRNLCYLAKVMFLNCAQLMDECGSHGEQVFQTNYIQGRDVDTEIDELRGRYSENWQVFWMTAAFLDAAARFEIMNIDVQEITL